MTILEPAVALTDFALAIECALLAWLLGRQGPALAKSAFIGMFAATGLAALLGGVSHGFLPGSGPLWQATLIAVCAAALASWIAAADVALPARLNPTATVIGAAVFAAQAGYILFVGDSFAVAIISYVPGALFLLIAFAIAYRRRPANFLICGLAGSVLIFIASAVQALGIDLHPRYFDHNALYHLIQGGALLFLFFAARGVICYNGAT